MLTIRNIVSTLFLAEGHYDIALLEQELLNLYEQESDKQAVSLFLNWFRQLALYGKVSPEDYEKLDTVEHCVVLTRLNRARFQCCSPAWSLSRLHRDLPAVARPHTLVFARGGNIMGRYKGVKQDFRSVATLSGLC